VKYQFKENPKMLKTMKEATKENKNDIADGAAKRGGQFAVFTKNLDFFWLQTGRNKIRMHSLVSQET